MAILLAGERRSQQLKLIARSGNSSRVKARPVTLDLKRLRLFQCFDPRLISNWLMMGD
jgi:hypothetical protein